jgi:hypothetical protein
MVYKSIPGTGLRKGFNTVDICLFLSALQLPVQQRFSIYPNDRQLQPPNVLSYCFPKFLFSTSLFISCHICVRYFNYLMPGQRSFLSTVKMRQGLVSQVS